MTMRQDLSIVEKVVDYLITDDGDNSEQLIAHYERCTASEKEAIDAAFIHLCGYSLQSMINNDA